MENGDRHYLYTVGEQIIAWRKWILFSVFVLTAAMAYFALRLELVTRFDEQLPQNHPFIEVHNKYAPTFGGANTIMLMLTVEDGDIFNIETLSKIFDMTQALERVYGVNNELVNSIAHRTNRRVVMKSGGMQEVEPVMERAPKTEQEVRRIRRIVHASRNLYGVLVSLDEKAALLNATFIEQRLDHKRLFEEVRRSVVEPFQDDNTKIYMAGQPALYGWVYFYAKQVYSIFLATTVLLWVLLYAYFRDVRGALRPTLTGIVSAIWGLGFIGIIGFSLDPLTLVIPFFITARAVSHSVQMHERYYEEYRKANWQKHPAIIASFAELFVPTLSGIMTDALGLLVILFVPILLLQKLAISAAVWILAITVSELLLNPIVYFYLRAPDVRVVERREAGAFKRFFSYLGTALLSPTGKTATLSFWGLVLAVSVYFWQHLVIGDPTAATPLLHADSPYNSAHAKIQETFGGVEQLMVVVERKEPAQAPEMEDKELSPLARFRQKSEGPSLATPEVLPWIENFQRYLERDPSVGLSFSFVDILSVVNGSVHEQEPKWEVLPRRSSEVQLLLASYFFGTSFQESAQVIDHLYRSAPIRFFLTDHKGANVTRVIKRAREYISANPSELAQFRLAGGPIGVLAAANEELVRNDILVNVLGFGTIFLVIAITYRSFTAGLYMLVPLLVANAVINAYMGARGIGINIHTLPVITVGIGFGIDYALYIVSRIAEEHTRNFSLEGAVSTALATSGKAVAFTAVTMVLGTLFWTFSSLRFGAEMGLLLALWMTVSFLATVTLLPVLLATCRPKFILKKEG